MKMKQAIIPTQTSPGHLRRSREALARKLRRKHFRFDHIECSGCISRERRRVAKEKQITRIEKALVGYGDENLMMTTYPALADLIQQELHELTNQPTDDNLDF